MKLKPADIDRILEDNVPKPAGMRSAHDFTAENDKARDDLIFGLIAQQSQSTARLGQVLPLPPKSLLTQIDGPNDFGIVTVNPELKKEEYKVPLPPALRGGDLDKIETRADLMALLTSNLLMNEIGLPKIIYRADLIDWHLFQGSVPLGQDPTERYKTMQEFLDVATVWLSYAEGFPALPTGEPLWAKLPFEDAEHYAAFTDYCVQPGARQVAKVQGYPVDQVLLWFHEDYWNIRVKCYDMLNTIHAAKTREQRILAAEDDHYLKAEMMMNKLSAEMVNVKWENLVEDPKSFVDVMEKVAKFQRLALGLGSQAAEKRELVSESMELTMKRVAQPNLIEDKSGDGGVDVRALLRNPEALASAQELVIRMNKSTTTVTTTPQSAHEDAE